MSLFKKADSAAPKGKGEPSPPSKSATSSKTGSAAKGETFSIEPLGILALENLYCPVTIETEGLSCHIELVAEKDYRVRTLSGQREISSEIIPPSDRKKKAVTEFMFKGLIGIHLHPGGMVLTLDQEKNIQGQPRQNQPPAKIICAVPPQNHEEVRARRFFTYDLEKCTHDKPIVVAINKEHMHFQVRMLETAGDDEWGMFISSPKGLVRDDSKPILILKKGISQRLDRGFFTQLTGSGGGIDARTWNKDVLDPIIMEVSVDSERHLTIEEMFTVHGLTVLTQMQQVTYVGFPSGSTPEQQDAHLKECEKTILQIRDDIQKGLAVHALAMALAQDRKTVIRKVGHALHKFNRDGVGILALELAVKEVLAPSYSGGGESSMSISHETLRLLNAISSELSGWVEADSIRDSAASAIIQGIKESDQVLTDDLDEMLMQHLPANSSAHDDTDVAAYNDVVSQAKRTFASKIFAKEIKSLKKEMTATEDKNIKKSLAEQLEENIKNSLRLLMHRSLARLAVKSHLLNIEKAKRDALNFDPTQISDQPISDRELETILTRYDAYSEYLDRAFEARITKPLGTLMADFQQGTNNEPLHSLSTKSFLAFLVALRTSGGSVSDKTENVPSVSSLQSLPDAIPDIQVSQPDPAEPKGLVRVVHREGTLLEAEFSMATRGGSAPEGVPNGIWFGFHDLAERIVGYYGEIQKKKDRDFANVILTAFTKLILLKAINLFRNLQNIPSRQEFTDTQEVLENAAGILSVRQGETADEELFDVRNRPKGVTEPPMNFRLELRQMVLGMEKSGELEKDAFRFKQRMRSMASMGAGKNQEKVALPITVRAQNGLITLEAKFNEEAFSKSVRLLAGAGPATDNNAEPVTTVGAPSVQKTPTAQAKNTPAPATKQQEAAKNNQAIIFKLVNSLPFFSRFSEYEKKRIAERDASFKMYPKDSYIVEEGTHDTAFFILVKGVVHVTKNTTVVAKLGPGEMFGEISFLTNTPRTMNIKAGENVLVLRMDQAMMNELEQESREKFKDHIISRQVVRLTETTDRLVGAAAVDITTVIEPPDEGEAKAVSRETAVALMDKLPFFAQFSTYEKKRIAAFSTSFRSFRANGEIIREGTLDTSFFIIIKGKVNVVKGGIAIAQLGPGEFFGDMAFLTNSQRTSSVVSQGEVLVMRIDQDLMRRMGSEIREKLKDQFLIKLTQRLLQTTSRTLKK
ncbi:MAG: cyclic nucleotide-binding domain-containing protein [Magnetococcales bacterium]|nr:cyclic nucleotide-binding domain-containing protein [Magnetococcales bacterium]